MDFKFYINTILEFLPNLISAIFILLGFLISGRILNKIITKKIKSDNPVIMNLIGQTMKTIFFMLGIVSSLGTLGIDVSAMVAGLGLTGFALGFALKDTLSNFISGVLVLIYKPFNIEDFITVDKYSGKVRDINLRYTVIIQEGNEVLVPNSFIFSKPIIINKDK
jgi:small-conductance mechanosensitive channel|tara:strand:- start:266 stop:760 length:495 start_codon:yes stop_codon:yes gene_type:complete